MIESFSSPEDLADAASAAVLAGLSQGLAARGRASLVATGGRSPGLVYDRLSRVDIAWDKVAVTLSDERRVDPAAPESNERLVRERLLVAAAADATFIPLDSPPEALAALTPFDAVLLGMGEDGHVASLIPGDPALAERLDPDGARLTFPVPAGLGSPPLARITLSLAALIQARAVLVLISGSTKRQVVENALVGGDLPVRALLIQTKAPVRVLWTA